MVDVVFYNIGWPHATEGFIGSIRQHMPDARITQLSDMDTPAVPGVDRVRRATAPYPLVRKTLSYVGYHFLADLDLDECLFLDMDMLINADVADVFDGHFDVAVCPRPARDGMKAWMHVRWPYCSAMFVKTRAFWQDVYAAMRALPTREWVDNMEAVGTVVNSGRYRVKLLDPSLYNRVPKSVDAYDPAVKIYHFKGGRKDNRHLWMGEFYDRHMREVAHA
jgi:hypothetical protein